MEPLQLRDATIEDVPALVELVQAAYRGEGHGGWTTEAHLLEGQRVDEAMVRDAVARSGARVLVADAPDVSDGAGAPDGALVACCEVLAPDERGVAHFGMFAVDPRRQGDGLGRAVLEAAERVAAETWGATTMEMTVIDVRAELIAWYERRGYRRTGRHEPFPYGDERFGRPRRDDLRFEVLAKPLGADGR